MPKLNKMLVASRDSRLLKLALWFLVALGIFPAILSQNLVPVDIFSLQFGIATSGIGVIPQSVGLTVFAVAVVICVLQNRLVLILLLLPWLAIGIFDVDKLNFKLPTYSQVQEQHRANRNEVKEGGKLPSTETIRADIDHLYFSKEKLLAFDKNSTLKALDKIDLMFERHGHGLEAQVSTVSKSISATSRRITRNLSMLILLRAKAAQLKPFRALPFGNFRAAYNKLLKEIRKRKKTDRELKAKRNALHAQLAGITQSQAQFGVAYERLFEIAANVQTQSWISQSYATWYRSLPYKLLCFAVFLVLVWRFSLSSWFYLAIVAAALTASIFFLEAPFAFKLWVVFKFVILSLLAKALYLICAENIPLLRMHSRKFLVTTLATTLKFYLPILFLVVLGLVLSQQVSQAIDKQLYSITVLENSVPERNSRRYDIDVAIDTYFREKERQGHARLDALSNKSGQKSAAVAAKTVAIYEDMFKPELPQMHPAFAVPNCNRFYHWITRTGKCAEKEIKLPLNDIYFETRDQQLVSIQESSKFYAKQGNNKLQATIRIAQRDFTDNLLIIRSAFKNRLSNIYSVIDIYTWVSALFLFVIIVKSFLYIFSRIFFSSEKFDSKRAIQFEPALRPLQKGSIAETAGVLKLTAKLGTEIYVNKQFDFANAPPDEATPQPLKAVFSRIRHQVWHLNRIETAARENSRNAPYRRIPENERIVIWTLRPGDRVIFSWKTFVGMNTAIKIKTQYSWRLSSLIFGRMFFVVASVDADAATDGTLLLMAKGNDGIKKSANPSNSPEQLLAWQTTTQFQLQAKLNFRNIYRSGVQIKAKKTDLAVMHLSGSKPKSGASAFLKYFLAPI